MKIGRLSLLARARSAREFLESRSGEIVETLGRFEAGFPQGHFRSSRTHRTTRAAASTARLQVVAADLTKAPGRREDGNDNGQPSDDYTARRFWRRSCSSARWRGEGRYRGFLFW
jgi:hypothetical protein